MRDKLVSKCVSKYIDKKKTYIIQKRAVYIYIFMHAKNNNTCINYKHENRARYKLYELCQLWRYSFRQNYTAFENAANGAECLRYGIDSVDQK